MKEFLLTFPGWSVKINRVQALMQNDTKQVIIKDGKIKDTHMGGMFGVELEDGTSVLAVVSGKMRKAHIRVLSGDRVRMEFSPHDLTRGRIVYRLN